MIFFKDNISDVENKANLSKEVDLDEAEDAEESKVEVESNILKVGICG